jgi:hypothetical protein
MFIRCLIAVTAACLIGINTNFALALAQWTAFADPAGEISVMLPQPVKATTTPAGGAQFQANDGDISYVLSFRRRSTHAEEEEIQIFCDTFAQAFGKVMTEKGHPIKITMEGQVSGKNWKGRIYRYVSAEGASGAFEIAIAKQHNFVLHAMGGADTDEATKRFFSSFQVN